MILHKKHKLLFAIYSEQHRYLPDMNRITPQSLQMDSAQFKVVVDRLCEECLIKGAVIIGDQNWPIPRAVFLDNVMLTESGMRYVGEVLTQAN